MNTVTHTVNSIVALDGITAAVLQGPNPQQDAGAITEILAASGAIAHYKKIGEPASYNVTYNDGLNARRILVRSDGTHVIAIVIRSGHRVGKSLVRLAKKALRDAGKAAEVKVAS